MIEVLPVASWRERREFLELPYRLYRGCPYWIPPLRIQQKQLFDPRKHPFHAHAEVQRFLARRSGQTVGRIAAILDRNGLFVQDEPSGFFGFLETVEDGGVADALLGAARGWLRARGIRLMRGPVNPSTNFECGLLVEGFDSSPCLMMTYNPPYYARLLEQAGLRKAKDLYAYYASAADFSAAKAERVAGHAVAENGVYIRPVRMRDYSAEVERFYEVYGSAWRRNWGFIPPTPEEVRFLARELRPIVDPDLALLAEIGDRLVGCALAVPDINQAIRHARGRLLPLGIFQILYHKRFIRRMRVLILGVVEEYRASGAAAVLYAALFRNAIRKGYEGAECSWILEDNVLMNRSLEAMGARRYKTYRIYEAG